MNPAEVSGAPLWLAAQAGASLLFAIAFCYLWRQSGVVYFGLWSGAWAAQAGALLFGPEWLGHSPAALAAYGAFEFGQVVFLYAAARAGFSGSLRGWRPALRTLLLLPVFVAGSLLNPHWFASSLSALLTCLYLFHFSAIKGGSGMGGSAFRASLLGMALVSGSHAVLNLVVVGLDPREFWFRLDAFSRHAFSSMLTLSAMALWLESQRERMQDLGLELDRVRRESLLTLDLDRLTGLLNQAALSRRMDETEVFEGVVVVCDMDDFKEINDRYGHLAGDEILRHIGNLLRTSIRHQDQAFRWGGDEFVILFHNQQAAIAQSRMAEIRERLHGFRLRGHGMLPISFSWGTAEGNSRHLRDVLDEADRNMYTFKRGKKA